MGVISQGSRCMLLVAHRELPSNATNIVYIFQGTVGYEQRISMKYFTFGPIYAFPYNLLHLVNELPSHALDDMFIYTT